MSEPTVEDVERQIAAIAKAGEGCVPALTEAEQRLLSVLNRVKDEGKLSPQDMAELRAVAGIITGATYPKPYPSTYPKPYPSAYPAAATKGEGTMETKTLTMKEYVAFVAEEAAKACSAPPEKKPKAMEKLAEAAALAKQAFVDTGASSVTVPVFVDPAQQVPPAPTETTPVAASAAQAAQPGTFATEPSMAATSKPPAVTPPSTDLPPQNPGFAGAAVAKEEVPVECPWPKDLNAKEFMDAKGTIAKGEWGCDNEKPPIP